MKLAKKNPGENLFICISALLSTRIIRLAQWSIALYHRIKARILNFTRNWFELNKQIYSSINNHLIRLIVDGIMMFSGGHFNVFYLDFYPFYFGSFARHPVCLAIRPFRRSLLSLSLSPDFSRSPSLPFFLWHYLLSSLLFISSRLLFGLSLSLSFPLVIPAIRMLPLTFVFRMVNPFNERSN